jgi:hypothetical protein
LSILSFFSNARINFKLTVRILFPTHCFDFEQPKIAEDFRCISEVAETKQFRRYFNRQLIANCHRITRLSRSVLTSHVRFGIREICLGLSQHRFLFSDSRFLHEFRCQQEIRPFIGKSHYHREISAAGNASREPAADSID